MTLHDAIMHIAKQYGTVTIEDGIVYVAEISGCRWSFTIPMIEKRGKRKSK